MGSFYLIYMYPVPWCTIAVRGIWSDFSHRNGVMYLVRLRYGLYQLSNFPHITLLDLT